MKTKIIGVAALMFGLGAWVWMACDKIPEDEIRIRTSTDLIWPEDMPEPEDPTNLTDKTVVLEDFTGVGCVNCPGAAEIAHGLQEKYGDRIIVVELHPSNMPSMTEPLSKGDADLRNGSAATYAEYWKIEGLPQGLFNRKQEPGHTVGRFNWENSAAEVYGETPIVAIEATGHSSKAAGGLWVWAKGHFGETYNTEELGDIHVLAMVLEDGFAVTQRTGSGDQAGYAHNHVLRAVIGGNDWGAKIDTEEDGTLTDFEYKGDIVVDPSWNIDNLSVAVLVCNAKTKEILNATKVKLN